MPGRVHAIVVVRPDGRTPAAYHLRRTVTGLAAQTRRPDAVTVVVCGADPAVEDALAAEGMPVATADPSATRVLRMPRRTSFAAAATHAAGLVDSDATWLLAQDTTPEPTALARLAGGLELSTSLGIIAPKLVRIDDPRSIVSLGVSMTRGYRAVELAAGDLDQGQHDDTTDVLGADIRGMLVRSPMLHALGGIDPALAGVDEGLDLAVASRLRGARVALAPHVRVGVDGDGVAGLPQAETAGARQRAIRLRRTALMHRRFTYVHPLLLVPFWLVSPFWAIARAAAQLITKRPARIIPELVATIVALVRFRAISRSRSRLRRGRTEPFSLMSALLVPASVARERNADVDEPPPAGLVRTELRFFGGGGAWFVLIMALISLAVFPSLLAWPALGGGALEPLRATVAQLWADATSGVLANGNAGPADPYTALIAVIGSLWPFSPSRALVLLWLAALPLAALGGWFAATRITERPLIRITAGLIWALAPTFLVALTEGVPTGVIVHLLLPWLFFAGSVAHRSWVPAGAASLVAVAVLAASPSLAPALAVIFLVATVVAAASSSPAAVARVLWLAVPSVVVFAPLVWAQLSAGNPAGLLADPGTSLGSAALPLGSDATRWLVVGFPGADAAGWSDLVGADWAWAAAILLIPLALLALAAPAMPRWPVGVAHLGVVLLGAMTAVAAVHVAVRFDGSQALTVWPGAGLSLAWWGIVGAAALTLDQWGQLESRRFRARSAGPITAAAAVVVVALVAIVAAPALSAPVRGTAALQNGPTATLPAYVAAEGGAGSQPGTLVLRPHADGFLAVEVVWGGSATPGAASTLLQTATRVDASADALAHTAADLISASATDAVAGLGQQGIGFILLIPDLGVDGEPTALTLTARASLDQRRDLDAFGATERGELWRVTASVSARPEQPSVLGSALGLAQLVVIAIALLLAIPTGRTRAYARQESRLVGLTAREREDLRTGVLRPGPSDELAPVVDAIPTEPET